MLLAELLCVVDYADIVPRADECNEKKIRIGANSTGDSTGLNLLSHGAFEDTPARCRFRLSLIGPGVGSDSRP
jgi:hypothetical protein